MSIDPGRQSERTALAWHRTALAVMLGPLVAARLLAPERGALAAAAAGAGLLIGGCIAVLAGARRRQTQQFVTGGLSGPPGAGLLLVTAAVPLIGALVAGFLIVLR